MSKCKAKEIDCKFKLKQQRGSKKNAYEFYIKLTFHSRLFFDLQIRNSQEKCKIRTIKFETTAEKM